MYYLACAECKKKVIEEMGKYRCERCNKIVNANVSYSFTAKVSDMSGSVFLSFLGEDGDKIIGMPGHEFKKFKENHTHDEVKDYLG